MLTDTHCRNAKPREKLYRLNDQRGLYLEVKPNGVKAWRYRFTLDGKASMFALGEYPAVTLSEARERSEAARKLVKQGINPAQQRQLDRIRQASEAKNTFEIVAKEWLADQGLGRCHQEAAAGHAASRGVPDAGEAAGA